MGEQRIYELAANLDVVFIRIGLCADSVTTSPLTVTRRRGSILRSLAASRLRLGI